MPVEEQLARLTTLSSAALRDEWVRLTSTPLPRVSPNMLRLALAWELQARAYGGLSRATQQVLAQHAAGKTRTVRAHPGMKLVREWKGTVHVVVVGEDGAIRWNDRSWNSLSEVAREITGTRWSGPAFFGLKRKAAAA